MPKRTQEKGFMVGATRHKEPIRWITYKGRRIPIKVKDLPAKEQLEKEYYEKARTAMSPERHFQQNVGSSVALFADRVAAAAGRSTRAPSGLLGTLTHIFGGAQVAVDAAGTARDIRNEKNLWKQVSYTTYNKGLEQLAEDIKHRTTSKRLLENELKKPGTPASDRERIKRDLGVVEKDLEKYRKEVGDTLGRLKSEKFKKYVELEDPDLRYETFEKFTKPMSEEGIADFLKEREFHKKVRSTAEDTGSYYLGEKIVRHEQALAEEREKERLRKALYSLGKKQRGY